MPFRVLVIDDEPFVRLLLRHALKDPRLEIDTAATGREALRKLTETPFDAAFVDVNLPDMTGYEIVRCARAINDALAIVMITAEPEHVVTASARVDAYLSKPFRLDALENALLRAMSARRELTAQAV